MSYKPLRALKWVEAAKVGRHHRRRRRCCCRYRSCAFESSSLAQTSRRRRRRRRSCRCRRCGRTFRKRFAASVSLLQSPISTFAAHNPPSAYSLSANKRAKTRAQPQNARCGRRVCAGDSRALQRVVKAENLARRARRLRSFTLVCYERRRPLILTSFGRRCNFDCGWRAARSAHRRRERSPARVQTKADRRRVSSRLARRSLVSRSSTSPPSPRRSTIVVAQPRASCRAERTDEQRRQLATCRRRVV